MILHGSVPTAGLTINGAELLLMSTSQNLFVQNLGLLVFPLFEEARRLKEEEEQSHMSALDQTGQFTHRVDTTSLTRLFLVLATLGSSGPSLHS